MWITFCQDAKVDKTGSLLQLSIFGIFWYTIFMEKFVTLKKAKRARKHGFLVRMKSHGGQKVIKRRRQRGRLRLAIKNRDV
jgi:large subunit ribosomal protein L34